MMSRHFLTAVLVASVGVSTLATSEEQPSHFARSLGSWLATVVDPGDGSGLELTATSGSGERRRVRLDPRNQRVEDVILWKDKVFVVPSRGSTGWHINIVPVSGSELGDFITSYQYAVSPEGRWVVFRKFFPRTLEGSSIYLVYDVALSPQRNRMIPGRLDETGVEVGRSFYPEDARLMRSYRSSKYHALKSDFFWVTSHSVAFLDYSAGQARVILASFSAGIESPVVREATLDERTLVDVSKVDSDIHPASLLLAESITLERDAAPLQLRVNLRQIDRELIRAESVVVSY